MRDAVLEFYTRPGCHLCDRALEVLRPLLRKHGVELEVRDVESDPAWEERHGQEIPVGVLSGRKVFKYRVDVERVERLLRGRAGRRERVGMS